MLPYIMQDDGFATVIDGAPRLVRRDHPKFDLLLECVHSGDKEKFEENFTVEKAVGYHYRGTDVKVKDGKVFFDGEEVHSAVVNKIIDFLEKDIDPEFMVKFLVNLVENPSYNSREQLYRFLEHAGMPITDDGCFLAYKGVTNDLKDCHTRSIDNSPGQIVSMARSDVDDNPSNHCSSGLHAGTFDYASGFGVRIVLVKINPKDCVSVPNDHGASKLRTCRYEVISEYKEAAPMKEAYRQSK